MKINDLKKLIKDSVREVIKEEFQNLSAVSSDNSVQTTKSIIKDKFRENQQVPSKVKAPHPVIKTGNPLLDRVLKETEGGIPSEKSNGLETLRSILNEEESDVVKQVAPEVFSAITKDYSQMLKKMDSLSKK